MSDLRVRSIDEDDIGTIISVDVEFDGELYFEQPVLIRGRVKGSIDSRDDVFISEEAAVEGSVAANRISVKGKLDAGVTAVQRIEFFRTAKVRGNITTPDLIVQSGAKYSGICTMSMDGESANEHA